MRHQILAKTAAFTLSIILLASLSACTPKPQTSEDRQKILNSMKGPEIDSVKTELLKQADAAAGGGDFARAAATMKQVLDKEPDNAELLVKYADLLRKAGQLEDAIKNYDRALGTKPDLLDAKEGKALAMLANGSLTDAGNLFGEVLKLDQKRWRSLNAVGILFALKNMENEADSYFQEALKQSNNSASVLNNIALGKAFGHDFNGAIDLFMQARSKVPEDSPDIRRISLNLALVYGIMGRIDEAQKISEKYLTQEQLYNNLGFYAILSKDEGLAKTYLNMALTQSPKYYERAWNNLEMISSGSPVSSNSLPAFKAK